MFLFNINNVIKIQLMDAIVSRIHLLYLLTLV